MRPPPTEAKPKAKPKFQEGKFATTGKALPLAGIVRNCRLQVSESYFFGGHSAALACLAAMSIRLYRLVEEHDLRPDFAHDQLWEVAENLTLIDVLGERAVEIAIGTGPRFYDELEGLAA